MILIFLLVYEEVDIQGATKLQESSSECEPLLIRRKPTSKKDGKTSLRGVCMYFLAHDFQCFDKIEGAPNMPSRDSWLYQPYFYIPNFKKNTKGL